jgi:hypothetical protein
MKKGFAEQANSVNRTDSPPFSVEYGAHQNTKPQASISRDSKSQAPNQGPSDVVAIQGGT